MKKRIFRFILPCLIITMICFCFQTLPAMESPSQEILKAAEKGMTAFLANPEITGSKKSPIAAVNGADMTLGAGFHIHTIAPTFDAENGSLDALATPTGHWRFLILSGNQPVGMLTVVNTDGVWQAVSIGGAGIARELFQVMNRWPVSEGYTYRFIRIFQARSDFIEISRNHQLSGFVPMSSSRISFQMPGQFDPATMMRNSEIFPQLKDIMSKHAQEPMLPGRK
jgi:hypothetical protein